MTEHARFLHELHYWIEIALAPFAVYFVYRAARFAWLRGWLGDDWPTPPIDFGEDDDDVDLVSVQHPDVEPDVPAPWRR